jgi:hypothetical protein
MRRILLAFLLLAGASHDVAADTVYQDPEDFLRQAFGDPPRPEFVWLDRAAQDSLTKLMGHPYRQARIRYWHAKGKTAWILDEIGKEYPITAGFVVQDQRIAEARVLIYRETRGMEIHFPSFLKQFAGAQLTDDRLSQDIDGISGATLSVRAMERMAKAALYLDRSIPS